MLALQPNAILPFITDTEENIEEIVLESKRSRETKYILPAIWDDIKDKQADFYFEKLKRYLPAAYGNMIRTIRSIRIFITVKQQS